MPACEPATRSAGRRSAHARCDSRPSVSCSAVIALRNRRSVPWTSSFPVPFLPTMSGTGERRIGRSRPLPWSLRVVGEAAAKTRACRPHAGQHDASRCDTGCLSDDARRLPPGRGGRRPHRRLVERLRVRRRPLTHVIPVLVAGIGAAGGVINSAYVRDRVPGTSPGMTGRRCNHLLHPLDLTPMGRRPAIHDCFCCGHTSRGRPACAGYEGVDQEYVSSQGA
jgi:hypothetical protein